MKILNKREVHDYGPSNYTFPCPEKSLLSSKNLAGFTKVFVDGRVVGVDKSKAFRERMIGSFALSHSTSLSAKNNNIALLEAVSANLEAGVRFLDKQEISLAKIGGKLSEIALSLNQARQYVDKQVDSESRFLVARECIRKLARETFDHTAIFSNAPSFPIVVAFPNLGAWEGLTIDRCDLSSQGFKAIESGKVSPQGVGYLLDPESISLSFKEWRTLCVHNRLQHSLLSSCLLQITHSIMERATSGVWSAPSFPEHSNDCSLRRPHRNN